MNSENERSTDIINPILLYIALALIIVIGAHLDKIIENQKTILANQQVLLAHPAKKETK